MCKRILLLITLTMMCMSGVIASDIYVPALPSIADYFHVNASYVQQSMSSYLITTAVFQLVYGSFAKKLGDKVTLLVGTSIFFLSSLACAYAGSINSLILFRALQAIGACSGAVIGVGLIGKLYGQEKAAKVFSVVFPITALSTAVSPIIGGYLTKLYGWDSTFIFISLFAAVLFCLIFFNLSQTLPIQQAPDKGYKLSKAYKEVLINKEFIGYALISSCGYMAYFSYFTQAPFIFHNSGVPTHMLGYLFSPLAIAYILGNFIANRRLKTNSSDLVMKIGILIFLLSSLLMFVGTFFVSRGQGVVFVITITMSVLTLGNGFFLPTSTAGAVSKTAHPVLASSIIGFLQFFAAAVGAFFIGHIAQDTANIFSLFIFALSVVAIIANKYLLKN